MRKTLNLSEEDRTKFIAIYKTGKFLRKEMVQFFPQLTEKQCISFILNNQITNGTQIEWTTEEDNLLKSLVKSGLYTYNQMRQFFKNRTRNSFINRCKKLGITNINKTSVIYSFDENFFDELNLTNIYWGGLFCADGTIYKKKNQDVFSWSVAEIDKQHMELFCSQIKSTYPLQEVFSATPGTEEKKFKQIRFTTVRARKWKDKLKEHFGIIPLKTKRFPPPKLNSNKEKLAYFKGYIDGDGSISCHKDNFNSLYIGVASSNKDIIIWFNEFINGLNLPSLSKKQRPVNVYFTKDNNCYVCKYGGFKAAILIELMMKLDTPFLERKWNNSNILQHIKFYKSKPEWPNELFFQNILNG